jgi:hypothetical protein
MMATFIAARFLGLLARQDDNAPTQPPFPQISIAGTAWLGTIDAKCSAGGFVAPFIAAHKAGRRDLCALSS